MDLTTVATIGQLAVNALTVLKSVNKAAEASDNLELRGCISELYNTFNALQARAIEIDLENRSLKEQVARKDEIEGPSEDHGYFFYNGKPDKPLCPKCWQSMHPNTVYLSPAYDRNGDKMRTCTICDYIHREVKQTTPRTRKRNTPYLA